MRVSSRSKNKNINKEANKTRKNKQKATEQDNGAELPPAPLGASFAGGAGAAGQHLRAASPGSITRQHLPAARSAGAPRAAPAARAWPSAPAERWRPSEGASAARPHCPGTHRLCLCGKLIYSLVYSMYLYNAGRG